MAITSSISVNPDWARALMWAPSRWRASTRASPAGGPSAVLPGDVHVDAIQDIGAGRGLTGLHALVGARDARGPLEAMVLALALHLAFAQRLLHARRRKLRLRDHQRLRSILELPGAGEPRGEDLEGQCQHDSEQHEGHDDLDQREAALPTH